jgi:hypothetical protein
MISSFSMRSPLVFSALAMVLFIASCGAPKPDFDPKNPPTGGTPAEFGFQFAQAIAKNGNCDQALPAFICLADQGRGWELAMHSGGVCALEAAKLWTGPLQIRPGFFQKRSAVDFNKPYFQSRAALHEKGLKLLRRSAASGWPDSQAVLVRELSAGAKSAASLEEAKLWLFRYDHNQRRKIYGGNALDKDIRTRLANVPLPPKSDPLWDRRDLEVTPSHDPYCRQVIRARPQRHAGPKEADDSELETVPGSERPGRSSSQGGGHPH